MNTLFEQSGAEFSKNRKYRYVLWRIWGKEKPPIMFIGLNPSTADETKNDRTMTRIINFCKEWGYGGVYMTNVFAYISSYPKVLKNVNNPISHDNDKWLKKISKLCKDIVFCWGAFKGIENKTNRIIENYPDAKVLGFNKNGSPKHPLYLPKDTNLLSYNNTNISCI